jgi:hypothetical protein
VEDLLDDLHEYDDEHSEHEITILADLFAALFCLEYEPD